MKKSSEKDKKEINKLFKKLKIKQALKLMKLPIKVNNTKI